MSPQGLLTARRRLAASAMNCSSTHSPRCFMLVKRSQSCFALFAVLIPLSLPAVSRLAIRAMQPIPFPPERRRPRGLKPESFVHANAALKRHSSTLVHASVVFVTTAPRWLADFSLGAEPSGLFQLGWVA